MRLRISQFNLNAAEQRKYWSASLNVPSFNVSSLARALFSVLLIFMSLSLPGTCCAQDLPVVITLKNLLQFEGRTFPIDSIENQFKSDGNERIQVVDDGLRRVFFNRDLILQAPQNPAQISNFEIEIWQQEFPANTPGEGRIISFGDFTKDGHRLFTVQEGPGQFITNVQGITRMTPKYCELETLLIPHGVDRRRQKDWTMSVATSSIPPDVLRSVLHKAIRNRENADEYLNVVEFFLQAKLYRRALEEQEWVLRKFPGIRDQQKDNLTLLRQAYTRDLLQEVRYRRDAGQPVFADQLADVVITEEVAGQTIAELQAIQQEIRDGRQRVDDMRTLIGTFIETAVGGGKFDDAQIALMRRFQNELETELNTENISRLDTFARMLGDQTISEDRKIALAISGWLLGGNNETDNFSTTASMFPVRDIVQEYLTSGSGPEAKLRRGELIQQLATLEAGVPKYVAEIVAAMKPPFDSLTSGYTGEKPIEFSVSVPIPGGGVEEVQCLAHLPPEYNPYRRYPCLITLRPGITNEAQLDRWCGPFEPGLQVRSGKIMRAGYVVVSVDWKKEGTVDYPYSAREHTIVLRALRETLRTFAVDSDRIFLQGHSVGATAAYDIGISHPEHWAGIIGIGGNLTKYSDQYRDNEHIRLPLYAVFGEVDRANLRASAGALNLWLRSKNRLECILVTYTGRSEVSYNRAGRSAEEFIEEVPEIIKWMDVQRRIRPGTDFEFDCKTLRPWDNYFWFWELTGLPEKNVTRPEHWQDTGHDAIKIHAKLRGNFFTLDPRNQGTGGILMLSPENVDFKQEIKIGGRGSFEDFVEPSSGVILEDVRTRGDRQHPYWAKLTCEGKAWRVGD